MKIGRCTLWSVLNCSFKRCSRSTCYKIIKTLKLNYISVIKKKGKSYKYLLSVTPNPETVQHKTLKFPV